MENKKLVFPTFQTPLSHYLEAAMLIQFVFL